MHGPMNVRSQYLLEETEESHKNVIEGRISVFELRIF